MNIEMSRSYYKIYSDHKLYFITTTVMHRIKILTTLPYIGVITDSLSYYSNNAYFHIYAYVIMPDHIHLIVKGDNLSDAMRRFKGYTARLCIDTMKKRNTNLYSLMQPAYCRRKTQLHQFWEVSFHPLAITDEDMLIRIMNYIHHNPVKANLVNHPSEYRYSSYSLYQDLGVSHEFCKHIFNKY